jgi:hypothetical protein
LDIEAQHAYLKRVYDTDRDVISVNKKNNGSVSPSTKKHLREDYSIDKVLFKESAKLIWDILVENNEKVLQKLMS